MSWMRKIFYVLLGVLQLGVLFISVLLAFYTYTMYENVSQKVKLFSTSPESNVSERQTDIDEKKDIDWESFAPFYFWRKSENDTLVLSKYSSDGSITDYDSVRKIEKPVGCCDITVIPESNSNKLLVMEKQTTAYIFDTANSSKKYIDIHPEVYGNVLFGNWSPDGKYIYYLFSADDEENNNYWVINSTTLSQKILLNGYSIEVLGWVNNYSLAYYKHAPNASNTQKLNIYSIDVRSGKISTIGYCDSIWTNKCDGADYWILENNKVFYEKVNLSGLYMYDYKDQVGFELFDILSDIENSKTEIIGISPDKNHLLLHLFVTRSNFLSEKLGIYEYNLYGSYWRHITEQDLAVVLWSNSGESVILKGRGDDEYYIHRLESYDVNPITIPEDIVKFLYIYTLNS